MSSKAASELEVGNVIDVDGKRAVILGKEVLPSDGRIKLKTSQGEVIRFPWLQIVLREVP